MMFKLFFLLISTSALCIAGNVPVLLWNNFRSGMQDALPSTLQSIPYSDFEQFIFNSFSSKNLVIFLQDELSIEDFSANENALKTVHKQVERHHSVYLPNVENPSFLINDLPDYGFKVNKVNANEASTFVVNSISPNALVVKLPPTTQSSSRRGPLQKIDEAIKKVVGKLDKLEDFTVIFTGLQPVQSIEDALVGETKHSIQKRNAKLAKKTFITDCVLFHVNKDFTYMKAEKDPIGASGYVRKRYILPVDKLSDNAVSECKANASTIQITYGGLEQLGETSVKFTFGKSFSSRWIIHSVEVKSSLSTATNSLIPPNWLPRMYLNESLACAAPFTFTMLPDASSNGRTLESLLIKGIQIEAFTGGAKQFSRAVDCVGFFSLPIWASLLVSLLLVAILASGFKMIVDLKTMDHFDDPKAKPLVQNTTD